MQSSFIDTNIFLRHLTGDPKGQAKRSTDYLRRVERGEIKVVTSHLVVFEVVFTLQRFYKQAKQQIRDTFLPLLELPNIQIEGKGSLHKVFDIYVELNLPFADAYHVVFMERKSLTKIVSFDRDFDKVQEIQRVEP